jgi:hypothetical protein
MTQQEAANVLGINRDTVAARRTAALERLRHLLPGGAVVGAILVFGGWALTRENERAAEPSPAALVTKPPAVPPQPVPVESIEARRLKLFKEIEQQLLTDLKPLALGGGQPELRGVEAKETRLIIRVAIPQRPEGLAPFVSELTLTHDTAAPVGDDMRTSWRWSPHFPDREVRPDGPWVLYRDEPTGWELRARGVPLEAAMQTLRGALARGR